MQTLGGSVRAIGEHENEGNRVEVETIAQDMDARHNRHETMTDAAAPQLQYPHPPPSRCQTLAVSGFLAWEEQIVGLRVSSVIFLN